MRWVWEPPFKDIESIGTKGIGVWQGSKLRLSKRFHRFESHFELCHTPIPFVPVDG